MYYRSHKGLKLSEIGIGCYSLSGAYGQKDPGEFQNMLLRAYELGVTFFDTADAYGDAEKILGDTVQPFREEVFIATKVGVKEKTRPVLSQAYLQSACEDSLDRLGTDYIDLYQIHFDDPNTPVEETIAALESLIDQGKIRNYGLGHLSLERAETYLQQGDVFSVLMELSAVAQDSYQELQPLCHDQQAAIIAFSITGRGLLAGKFKEPPTFEEDDIRNIDPLFQRERFEFGMRVMEKLARVGKRHNKTPAQTAISWVLSQEDVICALTGPSTVSHLEENLGGSGWQFNPDELEEINSVITREEMTANRKARSNVDRILANPLLEDSHNAFTDLIYAIETAIRLDLVDESQVLTIFYDLYDLRKKLDRGIGPHLKSIQKNILRVIDR